MENLYRSLRKLLERYSLTNEEIQGFVIFQVTYEIIYHYYHRYCVVGYKGIERILDLLDCFSNKLSDDDYNDLLQLLIYYMNEEKKVQKQFIGKTFHIFLPSTQQCQQILLEILNGEATLLHMDVSSYIYVKAALFNILQCSLLFESEEEGSIIHMISDELLLKLVFLQSNQQAIIEVNDYFINEIAILQNHHEILSAFVRAINKYSRIYNHQIEPKILNKIFDSFHEHRKSSENHKNDDYNQSNYFGSSVETIMVEIVRRDFPFDQLDVTETPSTNEPVLEMKFSPQDTHENLFQIKANRSNWKQIYGPIFSQSQQENKNLATQKNSQRHIRKRKYSGNLLKIN